MRAMRGMLLTIAFLVASASLLGIRHETQSRYKLFLISPHFPHSLFPKICIKRYLQKKLSNYYRKIIIVFIEIF